jgi:hypothetical protein
MMTVHSSAPRQNTGACLDDLRTSRFLPKRWVGRISAARDSPSRLGEYVRNLVPDAEWRAYSDEEQIIFAVARRHTGEPESATAIDVYFLDGNAVVYSAGAWEFDSKHGWWLGALLDVSYDCERGWWHDGLNRQKTTRPRASSKRVLRPIDSRAGSP